MMKTDLQNQEYDYTGPLYNGFMILAVNLVIIPALIAVSFMCVDTARWLTITVSITLGLIFFIMMGGYFIQQPNQARVMIFFGKYRGTFRATGFWWVNPFMEFKKISLRIRNMDVPPIKVNDKAGNPVMIGMVLVWKVKDTYRATFDVDTNPDDSGQMIQSASESKPTTAKLNPLNSFVRIQSDAALREITGHFAYDNEGGDTDETTLRGGSDEVVTMLENKLNERLAMAGIEIVEARLNYLAYAPEIAAVMLRRQQASAIISAREKIVEGAVSMVKMALDQLHEGDVVELDEERKATMVSNLLVVLCADEPAQPIVNAGTLYN